MECLKCGRETDQTFCEGCRKVMEKYPVKQGTAVQLPKRRADYYWKHSAKRHPQITPEMQVELLKRKIRRLWGSLISFVVLTALLCAMLYHMQQRSKLPLLGQNYSTVTTPTEEQTNH